MDLRKLLIDISSKAGMKKIPHLIVCKGSSARARFSKIYIGRKLLSRLTERETEGIIAHEVYHATKFKINFVILSILLPAAIAVVELIAFLALIQGSPALFSYLLLDTFTAFVLISVLLFPLALGRRKSRMTELRADKFGASIVGGRVFAKALKKVYLIQTKRGPLSRLRESLLPHPPLNKRLKAIVNVRRLPYATK